MTSRDTMAILALLLTTASGSSEDLAIRVTDFQPARTLTWSNSIANAYCQIEFTPLLQGVWNPFGGPFQATNHLCVADLSHTSVRYLPTFFFRVKGSPEPLPNPMETTRVQIANRSGSVVSNLTLSIKNHYGHWVERWDAPDLGPSETLPYHDFVIPFDYLSTSWVGWISGSYQLAGEVRSVFVDPWPFLFALVIDEDGHCKEHDWGVDVWPQQETGGDK